MSDLFFGNSGTAALVWGGCAKGVTSCETGFCLTSLLPCEVTVSHVKAELFLVQCFLLESNSLLKDRILRQVNDLNTCNTHCTSTFRPDNFVWKWSHFGGSLHFVLTGVPLWVEMSGELFCLLSCEGRAMVCPGFLLHQLLICQVMATSKRNLHASLHEWKVAQTCNRSELMRCVAGLDGLFVHFSCCFLVT